MRAIAYLRVSTEDQAAKGVSLQAQRAKVAAYADLYDLELVAVIEDAGLSLRKVGVALAERGHRSRTGREFAPAQVERMLAA